MTVRGGLGALLSRPGLARTLPTTSLEPTVTTPADELRTAAETLRAAGAQPYAAWLAEHARRLDAGGLPAVHEHVLVVARQINAAACS